MNDEYSAAQPKKLSILPRLLSVQAASVYLSISSWTVRGLIYRGELPCVRIGRRVLLKREDLERFIETNTERANWY